jgi:hypothetical protein
MTKLVRIENADIGTREIVVEVWEQDPSTLLSYCKEEHVLSHPTDLAALHVWGTRYLVIKEKLT